MTTDMFMGWCKKQAPWNWKQHTFSKNANSWHQSRSGCYNILFSFPLTFQNKNPFVVTHSAPAENMLYCVCHPITHIWNKAWLKITLPQLFFSAKEIACHISAAFRRPANLIKFDHRKEIWPEFVMAQMIFVIFVRTSTSGRKFWAFQLAWL